MGLSRTVSDIDGDFSRKSQNFPTPSILRLRLEFWYRLWGQKIKWWATGQRKKFDDIFSRLDTIHQRDRRTDGRTPGHSKDRAYAYAR